MYRITIILSIAGLLLPSLSFAQEIPGQAAVPQTVEEAKDIAMTILQRLPEALKKVWEGEALPIWKKMWEQVKPAIEPLWNKFLGLLGREVEKRRPALEQEFQREREEMQNDLWQRFKDLLR